MEVRSPMVAVKALTGCLPAALYWGCSNWSQSQASAGYVAMGIGKFSPPLTHGGAARPSLVIGGVLDWTRGSTPLSRSIIQHLFSCFFCFIFCHRYFLNSFCL